MGGRAGFLIVLFIGAVAWLTSSFWYPLINTFATEAATNSSAASLIEGTLMEPALGLMAVAAAGLVVLAIFWSISSSSG